MSTLEEDFVSTLSSTFSGRLYCSVAPANAIEPYATYEQISGNQEYAMDGRTTLTNARMQLDIFGRTKSAINALAASAETAMDQASAFKSITQNQMDLFEDAKLMYRVMRDFSIWRNG